MTREQALQQAIRYLELGGVLEARAVNAKTATAWAMVAALLPPEMKDPPPPREPSETERLLRAFFHER